MKLNIADDFMLIDNLESVTLKIHGQADVFLRGCVLSEPYTIRELDPTNAQVLRQGALFVWPKKFSGQPPLGSIIVDADPLCRVTCGGGGG